MSHANGSHPTAIIVMGVSGCGKSTVGALLARELGWDFKDGDAFHPPANVEKMRSGAPLTDADRGPWLDAIAAHVAALETSGGHVVVACSALKRVYRDRLRAGGRVLFVHLAGTYELIDARMKARKNHFMPPSLLESQFATLEPPAHDEPAVTIPIDSQPADIARRILTELR
jgi:gluconokinase